MSDDDCLADLHDAVRGNWMVLNGEIKRRDATRQSAQDRQHKLMGMGRKELISVIAKFNLPREDLELMAAQAGAEELVNLILEAEGLLPFLERA